MSKGTLGIVGDFEYFECDGQVYRANKANPIGVDGYRMGGRWECRLNLWPERWSMISRLVAA
jgi:hypothetical protein